MGRSSRTRSVGKSLSLLKGEMRIFAGVSAATSNSRVGRSFPSMRLIVRAEPVPHLFTNKTGPRRRARAEEVKPESGQPDLNRRPLRPERSALPGCAMPRVQICGGFIVIPVSRDPTPTGPSAQSPPAFQGVQDLSTQHFRFANFDCRVAVQCCFVVGGQFEFRHSHFVTPHSSLPKFIVHFVDEVGVAVGDDAAPEF